MFTSPSTRPRVWLVAGLGPERGEPVDHPDLRDDQGRVWRYAGGQYHTADNRHHASFAELHGRSDLVARVPRGDQS